MTAFSPFHGSTLTHLLQQRARERRDHPFLIWVPLEGDPRTWTYGEFEADTARIAGGIAARGIGAGDRVLVHFENCPEALLVRFALARLGAICVATNAMAAGPEITHYAASSRASAAITQAKFADLVSSHAKDARWVAAADLEAPAGRVSDSLHALFGEPAAAYPSDPSDAASIMFTTGTTGKPKGVVWTHANLLWACRHGAQTYGHRHDDVSLVFLPLFHVVGLCWSFLPVLWAGGTAVLLPRFSASRFWPVSLAQQATLTSQVLFTSKALAEQAVPERHAYRQWTVARGDVASQSHNRIPHFVPSWGMTEMIAPAIHGDPLVAPPEGALGRPSPAYRVRVLSPEGKPARIGETGDLLVQGIRGQTIFLEYDGDEAASRAAFDDEAFFRTGDRVTLLEDGWLKFSDRASDVIKVGGEGVSPLEIETVVRSVPGVRDAAVVGAADATYGQVPVAFIEIDTSAGDQIEARILQSCRASLAKFKVPRRIVILPALPRIGNAKVARAKLRQMLTSDTRTNGRTSICEKESAKL